MQQSPQDPTLAFAGPQSHQTFRVGTAATLNLPAVENAAGTVEYTVSPALPAGLSIDTATGRISGTPTAARVATAYTVTATDMNGAGNSDTLTFDITIAIAADLTVGFNPVTYTVNEGAGTVEFTVELSAAAPTGGVTVHFQTSGGPPRGVNAPRANAGDYVSPSPNANNHIATIAQGQRTGTATVGIIDDNEVEPTETFRVQLLQPGRARAGFDPTATTPGVTPVAAARAQQGATVMIVDNDGPTDPTTLTVNVAGDSDALPVGAASDVTVMITDAAGTGVPGLHVMATRDFSTGSAASTISDFTDNDDGTYTATVTSTAEETVTFVLSVTEGPTETDQLLDPQPTFEVTFVTPPAPMATITGPETVAEGDTATYTVTLSGSPSEAVRVQWALNNGSGYSADPVEDFTSGFVSQGALDFAAGTTTLSQTISVPTRNDDDHELPESFTMTLDYPVDNMGDRIDQPLVLSNPLPSAETALIDNDMLTLSLGAATYSFSEAAGSPRLPVTLSGTPAVEVKVTLRATDGTGDSGATLQDDYTFDSSVGPDDDETMVVLTFAARATGAALTQTATLDIVDDADGEGNETLTVALVDLTLTDSADATVSLDDGNVALADPSTATVTILDDDVPTVTLAGPPTVAEDAGTATYTVTLDEAAPSGGVAVPWEVIVDHLAPATPRADAYSIHTSLLGHYYCLKTMVYFSHPACIAQKAKIA